MKKKIKVAMTSAIAAVTTLALTTVAFAENEVQGVIDTMNNSKEGSLNPISKAIQGFAGNIVYCILAIVAAIALVVAAVALLKSAAGGQRSKEEAKGQVVIAVICIILAIPSTFFGIAGVVADIGGEIGDQMSDEGKDGADDSVKANTQDEDITDVAEMDTASYYLSMYL